LKKSLITDEDRDIPSSKKRQKRGMKMGYVTLKIPEELIKAIDEIVIGKYGYRSRAEFVKEAIRDKLKEFTNTRRP